MISIIKNQKVPLATPKMIEKCSPARVRNNISINIIYKLDEEEINQRGGE